MAVGLTAASTRVDDPGLGVGGEAQVEEAGARDLGGGDRVGVLEARREPARQLGRRDPRLLRRAQREVGGVVAVLGVARALHRDRLRQHRRVEAALGQHVHGDGVQQVGQGSGGHPVDSRDRGAADLRDRAPTRHTLR